MACTKCYKRIVNQHKFWWLKAIWTLSLWLNTA
ncbi:DNA primase catalytic core, N-terminal domain protein, partial [Vibrio parahaemolyticus V-223/04]